MEVELKCPLCNLWYRKSLLLPCGHSLCNQCAVNLIKEVGIANTNAQNSSNSNNNNHCMSVSGLNEQDSDHLSESSEADSGVVLSSKNQATHATHNTSCIFVNNRPCAYSLNCPACKRLILLDSSGVDCLVQNKALDRVVEKFKNHKLQSKQQIEAFDKEFYLCQVCNDRSDIKAEWLCEQCELMYCAACLKRCHPPRGALARHQLHSPSTGRRILDNKSRQRKALCPCHQPQEMSLFCSLCRMIICSECVQQFHLQHEIHSIDIICKQQKTELSSLLQSLSEKAKSGMQFVHGLKSMSEKISKKSVKKEQEIISTIDELISQLNEKKEELIREFHEEKNRKNNQIKDYIHQSTNALSKANGCIQFCIEMLRETDAASFLLISNSLLTKVANIEQTFVQEIEPKISQNGDFSLQISDIDNLQQIVANLTLIESPITHYCASIASEYVSIEIPKPPIFWPEQCICTNNMFTVVWQPYPGVLVQCYTLEIDDGSAGPFKKVYRGADSLCTVEGLHFDSLYSVRVRAHNQHGDSNYSDVICLKTGKLCVFNLNHKSNPSDVYMSNNSMSVTTDATDDRVILGSTGLSRGIHYWEWRIDRYDPHPSDSIQPAFGIARSDCKKDEMLGTDDKGWSMYINNKRSWFLHKHEHFERVDGGIFPGSVVGVRLDCDKGNLSFYLNDEPHGPIGFSRLTLPAKYGTLSSTNSTSKDSSSSNSNSNSNKNINFYPAVSLCRGCQVTLIVGRQPPSESSGESSEDDDTASTAILMQ